MDIELVDGEALGDELKEKLKEAGCFKRVIVQQILLMLGVLVLYFLGYATLLQQPNIIVQILVLFLVAFSSVQAGFIAHEAGHGAITKNAWLAKAIGQFFDTFIAGLSFSHFQYIHASHHLHTNERAKDLDMQSEVASLYPEAVGEKHTWLERFITRYQGYVLWPLISLQGFTIKLDGIKMVLRNPRDTRADQLFLVLHLLLWFGLPAYILGLPIALVNYFVMTWFIGPYIAGVFLINHIGMHVVAPDEKLPLFTQQLITTRNAGTTKMEDFVLGGLNNHIEHHMFPTIASYNLRRARFITRQFCAEHGLPYHEVSYFTAVAEVYRHLQKMARLL